MQGIYIPDRVLKKIFDDLPDTNLWPSTTVTSGQVLSVYIEYCTWRLWKVPKDAFSVDDGLQYLVVGNSLLIEVKAFEKINQILAKLGLIKMYGPCVVSVKMFKPPTEVSQ